MKIVVVGGTGLIGSKTVAILRSGGNEVVAASPKRWSQHRHRGRAQRSDRRRSRYLAGKEGPPFTSRSSNP
ncbi:hypothetical protein [Tunturiibacter gelidiferens]|uniref:hypothetical protein n=1 Tax=Tunturiibacter gelidiferens TaxID=3069689 RepID=UPI003D9B80B3